MAPSVDEGAWMRGFARETEGWPVSDPDPAAVPRDS